MNDLVKRLRERTAEEGTADYEWTLPDPDCTEAADRIEELEAQLGAALALVNKWSWNKKDRDYSNELLAAISAAQREAKR